MKPLKRPIHGIFLLDKPLGMSSNKALKKVQHLFRALKAGHTGSLDPLATGLLPICLGEATKLSQYLLDADKTYRVTAKLGQRTTTCDAEGEIIEEKPIPVLSNAELEKILMQFRGEITQIPPIYSALKVAGKPLYHYARQGIEVSIKSRQVTIYKLELIDLNASSFALEVHCTKGTYIRTLIDDIGQILGCGAHVSQLRRNSCAGYTETQMLSLASLESAFNEDDPTALDHTLLPLNSALPEWPTIHINEAELFRFRRGQTIKLDEHRPDGWYRISSLGGELLGLGTLAGFIVYPKKVFQLEALGPDR